MNRSIGKSAILAAFLGFLLPPVNAQVNLKAGYNISFVSDPGVNQVVETFNSSQTYISAFNKFSWMHGIELGFRFKADIHAFEISYQNAYQLLQAKDELIDGSGTYRDKIRLGIQSGAIGYQVTGDFFGIGTDLQYQWYTTKVDLESATEKFQHVQNMLALKCYMMFTLEGSGGIDASLQPYFVMPFDSYDLDPLSIYLNQEAGPVGKKWTRFGLSVLFYNGNK